MDLDSKTKTIDKIETALMAAQKLFLFTLPWQTIWIYREVFVGGVKMEYATLGFYATEILLWTAALLFIAWYWRVANTPPAPLREGRLSIYKLKITRDRVFVIACLSFISYLFISIAWSADKALALQQSLRIMEAFLLFFMFALGPLKFSEAVKWLALGAVLPSLLGIWQFFSQSTFAFKWLGLAEHIASNPGTSVVVGEEMGRWLRAYGPFSHPNVLGGYAVLVIVLMLLRELKVESRKYKVFWVIGCYLLISAAFFSFSRAAWLALSLAVASQGKSFLLSCSNNYWGYAFRKVGHLNLGRGRYGYLHYRRHRLK